jgi:hypothetical protein
MYLFIYVFIYLSVYICIYLYMNLFIYVSIYSYNVSNLSIYLIDLKSRMAAAAGDDDD